MRDEESLKNEIGSLEKKLNEITREKSGYENERKTITTKS